jgi:hypothetical protein
VVCAGAVLLCLGECAIGNLNVMGIYEIILDMRL